MPKRNTINTITLGIFSDENVSVICEDTIKLERGSVAVLSGNSEVGKSFLALKVCANAINDGLKPFFWSIEDKNKAILERIKNIENFYPFNSLEFEFSNELPKIDKEPMDSLKEELNELADCDLIVLDTFSAFFSILGFKDQNNQNDVQNFFNILTDVAKSNNQAILLLHHLDKKGESLMGSSVIINAPRLVYKLSFQKGEDKSSTTYRLLEVLKDNNNINAGEFQKTIKVLQNSSIDEPLIKDVKVENIDNHTLEIINKKDISAVSVNDLAEGYVTMNENRGVFYLSSRKLADSNFYKYFKENDNKIEFGMLGANGSSYAITLKNSLLTQTHRSILDALFLYIKKNVDTSVIKKYQENFWDMEVRLEPYKFLKQYLNKAPSNYSWLKQKFTEISRFAYDLAFTQNIEDKDKKTITQRDKGILMFDSVERITKENGVIVSVFVLTVRREYIKRLETESTLSYDDDLSKILIDLNSLVAQDLIRFLTSFPDKKILSYSEFCEIKAYRLYKESSIISKQKKEIVKLKDKLIEFGINVYGKGVEFANYDDEFFYNQYKNENDLFFIYQSNNRVKRYIKRGDPMNQLNTKSNKFL
ncbi:AAA family ATPase, partial [Campylobacter jejuni]|nr:AAA family ATPase [Campylobacter jejuni]EMB8233980.1 AAA family ATPase [Campylobacter jejuni]